jgi:hypothetical protein
MSKYFQGLEYQKGYGLGGTFRKFFKWIVPLIKQHAVPALAEVGKRALNTAADITKDVVAGKSFRDSSEQRINTSVEELKSDIEKKLEGKGKGKKILIKKKKSSKFKSFDNFFQK